MESLLSLFDNPAEKSSARKVQSLCATEVAKLVMSREPLKAKRRAVETLRGHALVQALPEKDKNEMMELFDCTLRALVEMRYMRRP